VSFVQAKPLATHDFYGPIHKGLRLAQTHMLVRLGACGGEDLAEMSALLGELCTLLHVAEHHLENEDRWVHPALEARAPGATIRLAQGHAHHRHAFEELEALIGRAETALPEHRGKAMHALYLRFSQFMADDFAHMAEEEQMILPVLQSLFTNEELASIEDQIISGLSPEEVVGFGRYMIPAATRADRIALLSGIRANAPAEAFEAIMELSARPTLSAEDFDHLCLGLGLTPPVRFRDPSGMHWGRVPS
jgi:hypothetical protein